MFKLYADKITSILICNDMINNNESRVYSYGFELLIAFIVNIIIILFLGSLFDKLTYTIFFLISYCPIRQFAGGYHADNYFRCLLTLVFIVLATILIIENLDISLFRNTIIIIASLSWIGICIMCPVEHKNNPISETERLYYKKVAIFVSTIVLFLVIIGFSLNLFVDYFVYSFFSLFWIFIMLILGRLKNKKIID